MSFITHRLPKEVVLTANPGGRPGFSDFVYELAGFGRSATSRKEIDSSSSWKCGRRKATERYAPGLPGISETWMDASRNGYCAFCSWVALSSSSTCCEIQR